MTQTVWKANRIQIKDMIISRNHLYRSGLEYIQCKLLGKTAKVIGNHNLIIPGMYGGIKVGDN